MEIAGQKIVRVTKRVGWRCYRTSIEHHAKFADVLLTLGQRFGTVVAGRNGALVEPIIPRTMEGAEERSLSSVYGLRELPMHVDTAHHLRPARYLLLGCANPGQSEAQTRLAQISELEFSAGELSLLNSTALLVRTGRRSFYSTILDKHRPFLRFDPGCMEPMDDRGVVALQIVRNAIARLDVIQHKWQRGEILLIDNWAMLHGRTATTADDRLLFRVSVQ